MFRTAFATLAALAFGFSAASADEVKGTVKKTNVAGNTITLGVDGKDKMFPVSKDASFVNVESVKGKKGKPMEKVTPIDGGLGGVKEGATVTVLTDKVENKDTITSVKVGAAAGDAAAKKKKKKKPEPKKDNVSSSDDIGLVSTETASSEELTAAKAKKGDKAKKKGKKKKGKKGKGKKKSKKA